MRDGQRDLHASIMLPAKCHKATVICLLSLHTFRTTHTHAHTQQHQQPLSCECVCGVCARLAYCRQCRRRCVSFAISKHLGTEFPKLASSTLNYQQISPLSLPLSPISAAFPPASVSVLALILVSAACCYCCSFPPHSLGSLNGQAAAAVAIPQPSLLPCRLRALNRIKNILCI